MNSFRKCGQIIPGLLCLLFLVFSFSVNEKVKFQVKAKSGLELPDKSESEKSDTADDDRAEAFDEEGDLLFCASPHLFSFHSLEMKRFDTSHANFFDTVVTDILTPPPQV